MKTRLAVLVTLTSITLSAQYVYDFTQNPVAADPAHWQVNGSVNFQTFGANFGGSGGSIIYAPSVSGTTPSDYELNATLALNSGGGTYAMYLRANSSAVNGCTGTASYFSIEITVPSVLTGSGTMATNECYLGALTTLSSESVAVGTNANMRATIQDLTQAQGIIKICKFIGQIFQGCGTYHPHGSVASSHPGVGGSSVPSGSGFSAIKIGPRDTLSPGTVSIQTVSSSILPNSVSLRWQGVVDDPNGIGVALYRLYRNGTPVAYAMQAEVTDATLQPQTSYQYSIVAVDYHGNVSTSGTMTLTTPTATSVDPRRVGVRPTGNYWGGGGEQVDTLSGNLNFSAPLLSPQLRSGTLPLSIAYNSQNWLKDGTADWQLGYDTGYGFGWKLQFGSLAPYYSGWINGVDHYLFTDGSGAEYRLANNTNGVWSSNESVYVWFDSNTNILHFKDGSFWIMGCTSGGTEADAGTMYPTVLEDTNGSQILVGYLAGASLPASATNTSARISTIEDVRGKGTASYTFGWNTDVPIAHLASISNAIGSSESYQVSYVNNAPLGPPFGSDPLWSGKTTGHLATITPAAGPPFTFTYDSAGAGELTQATYPGGGHLRWNYSSFTYNTARQMREISSRYVAADPLGQTEWGPYAFSHDDSANASPTVHANTTLLDASGVGAKTWTFFTPHNASSGIGLASQFVQAASSGGTVLSRETYTWSLDGGGNEYISTKTTALDESSSNPQTSQTTVAADQYGNVTQQKIYDYNSLTTPIRTITNTWLHTSNSNYANAYIRNRLLTSVTTDNLNNSVTTVSNTYDSGTLAAVSGSPTEFDSAQGAATNHIRGNVTQTVTPGSTESFTYDVAGHMITGADATGTGATMTYSATTNFAAPDAGTPVNGTPDVQNGRAASQVSGNQLATNLAYNAALALTSSVMPNSATTSQNFSPSTGLLTSSTSVHGATTNYTYSFNPTIVTATTNAHWSKSYKDGFGRDLAVESGYGTTVASHTATVYGPCACSPLGKAKQVSLPYGISGGVITASDGTSNIAWNTYAYDGLGRTLTQTAPDASVTRYLYLGNTTKITDPAGNWKRYTNDALGNMVKVEEPNPAYGQADNAATNFVTNYTYDLEGHLTQVAMPRPYGVGTYTQTRAFRYDLTTGHLLSATNPENGTVNYAYYPSGRLQSRTDARGQKTLYSYDGYGRLAFIDRLPDGVTWDYCHSTALQYDSSQSGTNLLGRVALATTGDVNGACANYLNESYAYTPGGLVTQKSYFFMNPAYSYMVQSFFNDFAAWGYGPSTTFTWDNEGHQTGYDGFAYTLDAMGRPTALTETANGTVWVQNAAYGPGGEMKTMQYRTNTGTYYTENRTYNNRTQTIEIQGSGAPMRSMDLKYLFPAGANNGQASQTTDVISGEQVTYQYDSLKRLIQAQTVATGWGQSFGYDGWGNLLTKTPTAGHTGTGMSLNVDPSTNHVTTGGFAYDANGNTTNLPNVAQTLAYDGENRTGGNWYDEQNQPLDRTGVWNEYGLRGERLATYTYAAGTQTWYPIGNPTIGFFIFTSSTATQVSRNIYFGGRLIQSNGDTVVTDRVGSVRVMQGTKAVEYYRTEKR